MTGVDIARMRMHNQWLSVHPKSKPEDVVAHFGAMQAQDYPGALWGVAQRTKSATRNAVEQAIDRRRIIRTWPMRGTLHFLAGRDARWMLDLLAPRYNANGGWATRRAFLGLTEHNIAKAAKLFTCALQGGKVLTRPEMYEVLKHGGISPEKQRGNHILGKLAVQLLLCFGPHRGTQPTFVLLDEWLPHTGRLERDEALARVTLRYFTAHGPATAHDMGWWSGLTLADIRRGLDMVSSKLKKIEVGGTVYWSARMLNPKPSSEAHLLPPFDEMLVGYKDRSASLHKTHHRRVLGNGNGIFSPAVMIDGQIVGTWARSTERTHTTVTATPLDRAFTAAQKRAVSEAADRYAHFLGSPVRLK